MPTGQHLFNAQKLQRWRRKANQAAIRSLCRTASLDGGTALCRVLGRYKMFVDTADVGLSPHLMLDGYWEMWLTEAMVGVLRPGMTTVDVGANLGYFTLLMADVVGPSGHVHAFEPNPPIADRLAKSVDVNGFGERVTLHRAPLSREDDLEVALCVPRGEPKNAHISAAHRPPDSLVLKTRRFDSYPELMKADVVKIDAEAAELDIWTGMSGLFDQPARPLIVFLEFASVRYQDPAGFLADIIQRGFSLSEVSLNDGVRRRTPEQILSAPPMTDQMLLLRR